MEPPPQLLGLREEARLASKISEREAAIKDAKHSISEQYERSQYFN